MKLLVLAGGFGSRLKTAISNVPKPLAPIGRVPFLELQIEHWLNQGVTNFTFLLCHQADQIINFLSTQQKVLFKKSKVDWLVEPSPMDTGGAIAYAVKELGLYENFLVANADTWLGGGVDEMIGSKAPAIGVVKITDVGRYGQVLFDNQNIITAFAEKTHQIAPGWINVGLCHLTTDIFKKWDGRPFSLERNLFPQLVNHNTLKAVPLNTEFIDIGIPEDYLRFSRWVSSNRQSRLCN